jgi:ACS family hexuronate transporter-like MFS transporter
VELARNGVHDANERWRVLALMTSAQAGSSLVQQALGSLSPMLVAAFALTKAQLGLVFSAILVGCTLCTAISGAFTDRWGERTMLLVSAAVMTVALSGATLFANYHWLVAMMGVYGAGYAASTPAGGRAILAWFDRDRGFAMGIRQTGVSVGALIGAVTLPLVASAAGFRAAFAFAALFVALPSGLAFTLYRESCGDGSPRSSLSSVARGMSVLLRDRRLIAVTFTCMLLSASQFIMNAFLTITATTVARTSVQVAGFALAAAFAGAICGRVGWGFVSDRYFGGNRLVPLAAICVLSAVAAGQLAFLGAHAVTALFCASTLLGLTAAGWNGLMAAALAEVGGTERAASALGLGLTGIFAASAAAPWLFGYAADRTSLNWAWGGVALTSLVAAGPVLWLRTTTGTQQNAPG